MLTVAAISSEGYYLKKALHTVDEYYTGGEAEGRWEGSGPQALGLAGKVEAEDIRALLRGLSPVDGAPMSSPQAAARRSRAGFDMTFSAPKGVSLLALLDGKELRGKVVAAHEAAVADALGYLEAGAAFVRRGKDGWARLPAEGLVGAAFVHTTSRLGDPQLHTHLVVANLAQGPDGAWPALDARALYRHARTAGFLYQASLRAGLTEALGISWRGVERGMAEPAGIPAEVLAHFSRRRSEIEEALETDSHFDGEPGREPVERLAKGLSRSAAKQLALAHAAGNAWDDVARRAGLAKERSAGLDICQDPY